MRDRNRYQAASPTRPCSRTFLSTAQVVVNHPNFNRGRIDPHFTEDASVSAELYKREKVSVRLQADDENLSDALEVIDFGGLFSGNAVGPARSSMLRLTTEF